MLMAASTSVFGDASAAFGSIAGDPDGNLLVTSGEGKEVSWRAPDKNNSPLISLHNKTGITLVITADLTIH